MRTAIALLLMLPLIACEPDSTMEGSDETLDDASVVATDAIDDERENVEEDTEEATN